jgi:SsrA-binding protein
MEAIFNKKANFNYHLHEFYTAGIILQGWEIKPVFARRVKIDNAFILVKDGEIFLENAEISPLKTTSTHELIETTRPRKLLMQKKEIMQLMGKVQQKGYTIVPTKIFRKGKFVKVEIALAKGKKEYDKRQDVKEREQNREAANALKHA